MPDQLDTALYAAFTRFTQHTRLIQLTTPAGTDLLAESVRGEESLSGGFRLRVDALSLDAGIELKSLVGQPVLLELRTAASGGALRPFHGHVSAARITGANGGFARYQLTIEPWLHFLGYGRDSRVFQDMTVPDILAIVFRSYAGRGMLVPAWRLALADSNACLKRSLVTQYQESDLAFVRRLLHEEGMFYFFEHASDAGSAMLGTHTLVVADHNGAFTPNQQPRVAFTQPGAVMKTDSLDRWRHCTRLATNAIALASWNYRTLDRQQASVATAVTSGAGAAAAFDAAAPASAPVLTSCDMPGIYAWPSQQQGQRIARNQIEASEVTQQVYVGAGTVRTFTPGTTFTLHGHASYDKFDHDDARTFLIVRTVHLMHNNLNADVLSSIEKLLGQSELSREALHASDLQSACATPGQRPLYRNRIDAIPASTPYRSSDVDGHGRLLHPRPTVRGQQTAIVVGPAGAVIHTDRDHRIKVQFHWQRGDASHSRMTHPYPDGHTGAPGNDLAGTWLRVATPQAGANWGSVMLPRVGQEVVVDFAEGNIDRPVVVGCVYNGQGNESAQHNQFLQGPGSATGNAPPWFPGSGGGHAHPAVFSGIKSQAMQTSQNGTGAYSQLVFDDSPGQARVALQRHTRMHDGAAELNLGHLRHQSDNARLRGAGFGAELKTVDSLALRAGAGLLLSAHARSNASGAHLDAREAITQIEASSQLQTRLARLARQHKAGPDQPGEPADLPAIKAMAASASVLATHASDCAYRAPQLQLASPAGIVASTPADAILAAATSTSIAAGQDLNCVAQAQASTLVASGITLFSYGKASDRSRPNQETGLRLHAASGSFSSQSQSGPTSLVADQAVTVASTTASIAISAPNAHLMLTAQGASIRLEGGNIEVHAPGKVDFKAGLKELAGPVSASSAALAMKISELDLKRDLEIEYVDADGNRLKDEPIDIAFVSGTRAKLTLDANGKATLKNAPLGPFRSQQPKRR